MTLSFSANTAASDTRLLAIECATEACSVALFEGGRLLAGTFRQLGRGHAEALVPMIADLPGNGRGNRIAVGLGPGSFTGVRIGLAAARALALAWGAECVGYPTLALIAAMAREQAATPQRPDPQDVLVATTGGHGEWFVQAFDTDGVPTAALANLSPQSAIALPTPLVAGSQAEALVAQRGHGTALAIWPDARCVLGVPAACFTADLSPLYGRAPDARLPGGLLPPAPPPPVGRRRMTPPPFRDDVDQIMAVMATAFAPEFGEAWNRAQIESALLLGNCRYYLIDAEGNRPADGIAAAGFAMTRQTLDEAELLLIAVVPSLRGRKLGGRLLQQVITDLRSSGAGRLLLEMREGNSAEHLYRSAGFCPVGQRPKYYRGPAGTRLDAITFSCTITP